MARADAGSFPYLYGVGCRAAIATSSRSQDDVGGDFEANRITQPSGATLLGEGSSVVSSPAGYSWLVSVLEEVEELASLAAGESAERLGWSDSRVTEDLVGFDLSDLGEGDEQVDHLGGGRELGRADNQGSEVRFAGGEVLLQLRSGGSDRVRALECFAALVERPARHVHSASGRVTQRS